VLRVRDVEVLPVWIGPRSGGYFGHWGKHTIDIVILMESLQSWHLCLIHFCFPMTLFWEAKHVKVTCWKVLAVCGMVQCMDCDVSWTPGQWEQYRDICCHATSCIY